MTVEVFVLDVDRTLPDSPPLGIDVETGRQSIAWDGKTVLIKRVKEGGSIHLWSQQHRRPIPPGARIIAVNGLTGAETILAECQKPQRLRLEIQPSVTATRRPAAGAEHVEEICSALNSAKSAAEAVQLLRRHRGHWHPTWGAYALLRIALRSTSTTKSAWAKDAAVLELAEWQLNEVKMSKEVSELEISLISLEASKRLGLPLVTPEHVAHVARLLMSQGSRLSTKSICRLLWLAAPWKQRNKDLAEVAVLLRVLRQRKASDFDGLDLRMLFEAARRWSETTWLQEPQRLMPGKGLTKEVAAADECVISFSVTLFGKLEGWSLLFTSSNDRFPGLYVSKDGILAGSFAKTKEGLKEDLEKQRQEIESLSLPTLQVHQLALVTLAADGGRFTLALDGQELPKIAASIGNKQPTELLCRDAMGTQVAEASIGHVVHRPRRSCPGKDVPLLQKLLQRLRCSDQEGAGVPPLFPPDVVPAAELVRMAEDLAHLELYDDDALNSLGREILRRRPELKPEELQLAKGAFAMMKLNLPEAWSAVGVKLKKRGADVLTQQAFVPMEEKLAPGKKRPRNKEVEETSPPPSPPRR